MIYRALSTWNTIEPYSLEGQDQLGITNLRVRLLKSQLCSCQLKEGSVRLPTAPYAIYDFIVKGACLCHGHADQCVPASGYQPTQILGQEVVSEDSNIRSVSVLCGIV